MIDADHLCRPCCQFDQQTAGADADLQHRATLRYTLKQMMTVLGNRQQRSGQVIPLPCMLIEKLLAASAPLFQCCRNGVQIALTFRQSRHLPFKGGTDGGKETVPFTNPKVAPRPLTLDGQHARFGQNFQVPGYPRLSHGHNAGQLLDSEFTGHKNRSQAETAGVCQCFEGI